MNVMRPHPTQNRGKGRVLRKTNTDLNIFQTIRVGTKNLFRPGRGGSISSGQAIGSSSLSRLQWSNQRSGTLSFGEVPSVSRILISDAERSRWTSGVDSGRKSTDDGSTAGYHAEPEKHISIVEPPFQPISERVQQPICGFFDDILNNPNRNSGNQNENLTRDENEANDVEMPFPSMSCMAPNQEEGAFFSMEQVLQIDSAPADRDELPATPAVDGDPSLEHPTSEDDYNCLFKTPMLPSKSNTSNGLNNDYESIFETSMRVRELPRLSTPLYSSRIGSEHSTSISKTTPSRGKTKTTKSTAAASSSTDSAVIVALTEGRGYAVGEVGLAFIDLNKPILTLSQISDCQTYAKTLSKIHLFNPAELIVPDTFVSDRNTSALYKRVTEYFLSIKVVSLKRLYFNGEQGLDVVRFLCLPEFSSVDIITLRKYYALASAAALLKYIEHEHNTVYAKQSIQVCYQGAKGVVALDMATSRRLELVKTHGDMVNPEKYSLMGIMDSTVTLGGRRRLRSEILQPAASKQVIEERLDVVTFLVGNASLLASLQGALVKFSNAEKLMWLCRKTPDFRQEKKTNETLTNYVLLLKSSLENIPPLRNVLSETENDFLINIRDDLADHRFLEMGDLISQKIHPDAKPTNGYQSSEINRCFSIKDEVNGLLDIARSTYSNLVQEIQDLIVRLADEHDLPLRMSQSAELGFHGQYVLPKSSDILSTEIPPIFTDVKLKGNIYHVSTDEMFSLNVRVRRAVQEIQLISNIVLFELVKELRPSVGCLYKLCENVAVLDVLCSLAKYSMTPNFVRPTFSDVLDVRGGRHPVLDHIDPIKPTPNDTFASKTKNLNIVTGPNMSGKTVYLLQIALLQIMAQMGSYVPAESAEFRIADHIYVRKDSSETVENKASAFTVEVKEIMYCLNTMTDTSLVILDEICTGTNNEGGTAVAWAICEEILARPAFTFLATHLHFLTNFQKIFINVTNYYMEAIEGPQSGITYGPLTYTHRLLEGITQVSNYGLRLMMTTSLPESMKKEAVRVVEALTAKRSNCLALAKTIPVDVQTVMSRVDKLEKFMEDLYKLSKSDCYSLESVQELQRLAVESIIIEELRSQVLNEPGTPPSFRNYQEDHIRSGSIPERLDDERLNENQLDNVPRPSSQSNREHVSANSCSLNNSYTQACENICENGSPAVGTVVDEQSQLDSDDLSDDYEDEDSPSADEKSETHSASSPGSSLNTYRGASTSPQYNKSTNSNVSSSLFNIRSNES